MDLDQKTKFYAKARDSGSGTIEITIPYDIVKDKNISIGDRILMEICSE